MPIQADLFEIDVKEDVLENDVSEWGTFRDSLKAPVHGWFTYPAGFSYKAVEHSIRKANLKAGKATIYDPFMGSGTTNLVAKSLGFDSIGVEAHPFVFQITKTKMNWDLEHEEIEIALNEIQTQLKNKKRPENLESFLKERFPELILKCFLHETLYELLTIRDSLKKIKISNSALDFLRTALICVLRDVSTAATGWPYIAPKKIKITSKSKKGFETYRARVYKMYSEVVEIKKHAHKRKSNHLILLGDSRNTIGQIPNRSADHIFTSPPYLNNFDYADRTRLELYFMGEAKDWGEISSQIRTRLMTSATTQINRQDKKYEFLESFKEECPNEYQFLRNAVDRLSEVRLTKGGKKSYDLMVLGYFNDMYQILKDNYRILKPNSIANYILGDSAPYGIHIPTDELIGQIGVSIGFKDYQIQVLRERGGKWKDNPQRHNVLLKESVVTLEK